MTTVLSSPPILGNCLLSSCNAHNIVLSSSHCPSRTSFTHLCRFSVGSGRDTESLHICVDMVQLCFGLMSFFKFIRSFAMCICPFLVIEETLFDGLRPRRLCVETCFI